MSKIESVQTRDEILKFADMDSVIGRMLPCNLIASTHASNPQDFTDQNGIDNYYEQYTDYCRASFYANISLTRHRKNGRICGYVEGENDDGSLKITLMGDSVFDTGGSACVYSTIVLKAKGNSWITVGDPDSITRKMLNESGVNPQVASNETLDPSIYEQFLTFIVNYEDMSMRLPAEVVLSGEYLPSWSPAHAGNNSYTANFMRYNNDYLENHSGDVTLTTNENTTLKLNVPFSNVVFYPIDGATYDMGFNNVGGDVYVMCYIIISNMCASLGGANETDVPDSMMGKQSFSAPMVGSYAGYGKLFNTVLTRNKSEAIEYVNHGTLPSDAFLFPYDVDNIPINDDGVTPSEPDDVPMSDTPSETDGDPDDDTTPTPLVTPIATPQSLTNNNLYWLLTLQLKNFIDWFWTDATSIASASDLWDKIRGLYENLSEAVLNIRYMPVDDNWIGGTFVDNSIIVGMIEKPGQVLAINKTVSPIRHIGDFDIQEFYKSFCDYSPYTDILLYLPFHGFMDMDTNILMGHKLKLYCAYDITSGTIQYFIYRDSELINTCVGKMAVDIPISLQTKSSRDSAIFQNVASATGSLISAGSSAIAGNPLGLVMASTGLAGTQAHGAPMSLKGTIGESGSFYAPNRCAIYIKSPKYNKPSKDGVTYATQVGYPCNGVYKLSKGMGYTIVYNPKINFNGNTYHDDGFNNVMRPTSEEINEIYEQLEKGVIL